MRPNRRASRTGVLGRGHPGGEARRRFAALFEQQVVGMAILTPAGRFIEVNDRLTAICGFSREELLGLPIQSLTHPEDLPVTAALTRRLLAGEIDSYVREERCRHRDGHWIWVHHTLAAVRRGRGLRQSILVVADITDRKRAEALLAEERERVRLLLDSTAEAIYGVDRQGRCTLVNRACLRLLGYASEADLLGCDMHAVIHHHHADGRPYPAETCRALAAHREGGAAHVEDEVFWRADGTAVPVEYWSHPIWRGGEHLGAVVTFLDISERHAAEARLKRLAHHDPLTGLPNRVLLNLRLAHAIDRARRHARRLALLVLDVDRFKTVNDSFGHPLGDELLNAIARRLRDRLRDADTLARPGGDEFVILLEEVDQAEDVAGIAQELMALMAAPFSLSNGREVYLTVSIGASLFPDDGGDAEDLLRNADAAMYQAKAQGRDTCRFYTRAITEAANARLALETRLRHALERAELVVHYQPLLAVADNRPLGVEALVRWRHPAEGLIPPDRFIPLAEETGLILPLGEWVLAHACEQVMHWRLQGAEPFMLAVNLSPRQFRRKDLVTRVAAILAASGLPAACLELEITEGAIMEEPAAAEATLFALKALGVRLAIDDFGTGYSSLAYLKRFPIDKLKIDKSFVRDIPHDHDDCQIAATIIAMARNLKLEVLAEGVETEAQLAFLREHGCDAYQGYLASRPVPAEALAQAWLAGLS